MAAARLVPAPLPAILVAMPAAFRPITVESLDRLLPFQARLYAGESIPFDPVRARRAALWLLLHPEAGAIWSIETADTPAGYLVLTICASLEFDGPFALLDELFIDEPFRRRGLGRDALAFAAGWARQTGLAALRLEVGHENPAALRLYRKSGFRSQGREILTMWLAPANPPASSP